MSHYTVGIIIPPDQLDDTHSFVDAQMAPYDESIKVAPYVCYSLEQAQLDLEREIRHFTQIIEKQHPAYNLDRCQEALDELLQSTHEQKYRDYVRCHSHFNSRQEPLSTYNPVGKWDWFSIGGRWNGWLRDREPTRASHTDNLATIEQVIERKKFPFAIITPDGVWHEQGRMGWWGAVIDGKETADWHTEVETILRSYAVHSLVLVDAHV